MELRRDLLISVGGVVVLNILLAFTTIGLFSRMSPAVAKIMAENVYSIEVAEHMLTLLALQQGQPFMEPAALQFERELERARGNITEDAERTVIESLVTSRPEIIAGDSGSVDRAVRSLQKLIEINRIAMREQDRVAQRLGIAGAWASVFVAIFSFLLGSSLIRRLDRRVIEPVVELQRTVAAARQGDLFRRCQIHEAPKELRAISGSVNYLLDHGTFQYHTTIQEAFHERTAG